MRQARLLSFLSGGVVRPWKQMGERRAAFAQSRHRTTDEEFVRAVFAEPSAAEHAVTSVLRRILARNCGIPTEAVQERDDIVEVESLMGSEKFLGWLLNPYQGCYDARSVHFSLEEELRKLTGRKLILKTANVRSLFFFSRQGHFEAQPYRTVGAWIERVVRQ